jgi:hypothetical protein
MALLTKIDFGCHIPTTILDGMATVAPSQQLIFGCHIHKPSWMEWRQLHLIKIDFECHIPTAVLDGMVKAALSQQFILSVASMGCPGRNGNSCTE